MDSSRFCGLTCHTPMITEYRAYTDSPHSRVGCAQCHIGPGTESFMRAKLAGVRQVFGVVFNNYSRPIPSPVESLRPARETCEACHWPQKFTGDKILVRTHYAEDAASTPSTTVLMLKIGGLNGASPTPASTAATWTPSPRITYLAGDAQRQSIAKVDLPRRQGPDRGVRLHRRQARPRDPPTSRRARWTAWTATTGPPTPSRCRTWPWTGSSPRAGSAATCPSSRSRPWRSSRPTTGPRTQAAAADPRGPGGLLQGQLPRRLQAEAGPGGRRRPGRQGRLPAQRLPRDEAHLGHPPQPHRATRTAAAASAATTAATPPRTARRIASDCDTCHVILAQDEKDPKILKDARHQLELTPFGLCWNDAARHRPLLVPVPGEGLGLPDRAAPRRRPRGAGGDPGPAAQARLRRQPPLLRLARGRAAPRAPTTTASPPAPPGRPCCGCWRGRAWWTCWRCASAGSAAPGWAPAGLVRAYTEGVQGAVAEARAQGLLEEVRAGARAR